MSNNLYLLKQRIDQSTNCDGLVALVREELTPLLSHKEHRQIAASLLVEAFQVLQRLTASDAALGEQMIRDHLLSYLEEGTDVQGRMVSQLRECLVAWFEQYAEQERVAVRAKIVQYLLERFRHRPSQALCWTFATIGYRQSSLVTALWESMTEEDPDGTDTALATLTALGVPLYARDTLLERIHQQLAIHLSQPLLVALSRLADAASLLVAKQACLESSVGTGAPYLRSLALRVLVAIANTSSPVRPKESGWFANDTIQEQVWQTIIELYEGDPEHFAFDLYMGGDLAPRCDSQAVVPTLVGWLGRKEEQREPFPLVCYRLEACIRPYQLIGWQKTASSEEGHAAIEMLKQAACLDTKFAGRSSTAEMHGKEAAWGTLLRLGVEDALNLFEEAVGQETNRYLRRELCEWFACFLHDPLPPRVVEWVTQPYDAQSSDSSSAELVARLGAVEIAHSAATVEAFEALLHCGLTLQGQPLLASATALAEVALVLAREGKRHIVDQLVVNYLSQTKEPRIAIEVCALEVLGAEHLLTAEQVDTLIECLLTQERDPYEQGYLITTVGTSGLPLPDELIRRCKQWARERNDQVCWQAFAMLAGRDMLIEEVDLLNRLGLQQQEDGMWMPMGRVGQMEWQMQVIGLLYQRHPDTFTSAVAALIAELPWREAHLLIGKLKVPPQLPRQIADALIQRIYRQQTSTAAEPDLIERIALLIPEHIAQEHWDLAWGDWLPEARAVLADVLGTALELSPDAVRNAERLLLLLTGDGQYAVRRASYRGLAHRNQALLQIICQTWAESDLRDVRLRAAEACAWLDAPVDGGETSINRLPHEASDHGLFSDPDLYQQLEVDPEPLIRETVKRIRQERQKRLWAREYLHAIQQGQLRSNRDILSWWPYAEALKHVSDDTTIQVLRHALSNSKLPLHIRHWYQLLLKEMSEGWQKAIKKWPQPGRTVSVTVEEGNGVLQLMSGKHITGQYRLWREAHTTFPFTTAWGGSILAGTWEADMLSQIGTEGQIQTAQGRRAAILLKECSKEGWVSFIGQGEYPQETETQQ